MSRTILMGDPAHFSVIGGANPHTRNVLGMRKRVDADRARRQWHGLARALSAHDVAIYVIPADPRRTGLVYPANAGFLYPLEAGEVGKTFFLANLLPTRAAELEVYEPFIRSLGYTTRRLRHRFEGEADFFPAGGNMIFTHGRVERQRFVPRLGLPPWKRVYGFRSDANVIDELSEAVAPRPILSLELCLEAHYHGDTVLCSFGPEREFLLAYMEGLTPGARGRVREEFGDRLLPLSVADAQLYAANSFQVDQGGHLYLFMPEGVSSQLIGEIRARAVEPVLVNVSEFLAKGGGSVKCMILDLGLTAEQPGDAAALAFRNERSYQRLFGAPTAADQPASR